VSQLGADDDVTRLLAAARDGDRAAQDQLFSAVYAELRRLARRELARHQNQQTLSTTVLVHETYLRLARPGALGLADRAHLLNVAAKAMRQIVIDHARRRLADKRGGGVVPIDLEEARIPVEARAAELVALDAALDRLEVLDPTLSELVEARFFAGRTLEDIAETVGRSERSLKRDFRRARAFLLREMGIGDQAAPA
jgi:RNA polymerase sigma factor (TIGR02999 family)